ALGRRIRQHRRLSDGHQGDGAKHLRLVRRRPIGEARPSGIIAMSFLIDPVVQDRGRRAAAIRRLRDVGGRLPTWTHLATPQRAPAGGRKDVDPDDADPRKLWRVHLFNGPDGKTMTDTPGYMVLPPELTGVKAPLVVLLGRRFPMIGAHKVLAAYACLVP